MFPYVFIAGADVRQGCRSSAKREVLCASRTTGARIQQGSESLAEFALRNAFRQQLLKCFAPIRQHCFAMHLEGDWRTCAYGYSAGQGGRLAFRPPCMEHMNRIGMAELITYLLIAGADVRQGCRSSAKHGGFVQQVRHGACRLALRPIGAL